MKRLFASSVFLILAGSVALGDTANATPTRACEPRSFDYFDRAGVEHTGIDLNILHKWCAEAGQFHPRSFDYVDAAGLEHTGIGLNLFGDSSHRHHHHSHSSDSWS